MTDLTKQDCTCQNCLKTFFLIRLIELNCQTIQNWEMIQNCLTIKTILKIMNCQTILKIRRHWQRLVIANSQTIQNSLTYGNCQIIQTAQVSIAKKWQPNKTAKLRSPTQRASGRYRLPIQADGFRSLCMLVSMVLLAKGGNIYHLIIIYTVSTFIVKDYQQPFLFDNFSLYYPEVA